jgi:hypothetical protein
VASRLLPRLGLPPRGHIQLALAAHDDDGVVVGVFAVAPLTASTTTVWLAVPPERRRLKIATDLFDTLTVDYRASISDQLVFQHRADCPIAASFIQSTGLPARRLASNQTTLTLC